MAERQEADLLHSAKWYPSGIDCARSLFGHFWRIRVHPRRAASIFAMSIFFISIIASKARLASAPPAAIALVRARGVICQDNPQRSLHQPQALSWPRLPTITFQ